MTKPLMESGMLSALWARLVGGTPATGKVPTLQADGTVQWQTPTGGGGADRSAVTALSIDSGVVTIDYSAGDYFTLARDADIDSWVIDNAPEAGFGGEIQILVTTGVVDYDNVWPNAWRWEADTPPTFSTGDGVSDVLRITSWDGFAHVAAYLSKGRPAMVEEEGGGGFADYAEYAAWAEALTVDNAESITDWSTGLYVGYESGGGSLTGGLGAGLYRVSVSDGDPVVPPPTGMWGSPVSTDHYATYDSSLGAWALHAFENTAAMGSDQPNVLIVEFDDLSSHTTTGVTKNGYTSSSYSAWTALRVKQVIYWDYNLGTARRYNASTNSYGDFAP